MRQRVQYFDFLRIIAVFAVILSHVSSQNWYNMPVRSFEWQIYNFYNGVGRWCVPIFVMISGALLLSREISIKTLYTKNIFRMVSAFLFWSFFYAVMTGGSKTDIVINTLTGYYHMWFIPMIIGLYICTPFLHLILKSESTTKYFLFISFVFTFLLPQLITLGEDFFEGKIYLLMTAFNKVLGDMKFHFVLGYTSYYVAGHYLHRTELSKKHRLNIYLLGLLGVVLTVGFNGLFSIRINSPAEHYLGSFNIGILLMSVAVFVWTKYNIAAHGKLERFINILSQYSFGAYLIHVFVIEFLSSKLGITIMCFNPLFSIPIISLIVFVLSFLISAFINNIPLLKKNVL